MKIKLIFLSGLMVLASLTASQAQIHLGVKGGANLSKLDGQGFDDSFKLGYQAGAFAYYNIGESVGLQAEVLFNQTNTSLENDFSEVFDEPFEGDKELNYISVPLLLRLNTEGLISVVAGPQFSFLSDDKDQTLANGQKFIERSDFAAVAGIEVNLFPVIIYGRYTWGFSDISTFGEEEANSQQIQLGVALRLF